MALAAAAAGADGLMIEVHNDPAQAKCDAAQAITPAQSACVSRKLFALCAEQSVTRQINDQRGR